MSAHVDGADRFVRNDSSKKPFLPKDNFKKNNSLFSSTDVDKLGSPIFGSANEMINNLIDHKISIEDFKQFVDSFNEDLPQKQVLQDFLLMYDPAFQHDLQTPFGSTGNLSEASVVSADMSQTGVNTEHSTPMHMLSQLITYSRLSTESKKPKRKQVGFNQTYFENLKSELSTTLEHLNKTNNHAMLCSSCLYLGRDLATHKQEIIATIYRRFIPEDTTPLLKENISKGITQLDKLRQNFVTNSHIPHQQWQVLGSNTKHQDSPTIDHPKSKLSSSISTSRSDFILPSNSDSGTKQVDSDLQLNYNKFISDEKNITALIAIGRLANYNIEGITDDLKFDDFCSQFGERKLDKAVFMKFLSEFKTDTDTSLIFDGSESKTKGSDTYINIDQARYEVCHTSGAGNSCGLHAIYGTLKNGVYTLDNHVEKRKELLQTVFDLKDNFKINECALKILGQYSDQLEAYFTVQSSSSSSKKPLAYVAKEMQDFVNTYNAKLKELNSNINERKHQFLQSATKQEYLSIIQDFSKKHSMTDFPKSHNSKDLELFLNYLYSQSESDALQLIINDYLKAIKGKEEFNNRSVKDLIGSRDGQSPLSSQVTQPDYPLTTDELGLLFLADQARKGSTEQQSLHIYNERLGSFEIHSLIDPPSDEAVYIHHKGAGGFHYSHMDLNR